MNRKKASLPDVAVRGHVGVEVGRVPEGLVADGALVRRRWAVRRLVLLEMRLLPEPLVADAALEWSLAWNKLSIFQIVLNLKVKP